MIERLIELEQARLAQYGYDTTVYPSELTVSTPRLVVHLGSETWILTGIRASDADLMGADHKVSICSPTNSLQATERTLSQMGQAVHRLFRHHIIIHTTEAQKCFTDTATIPEFTLSFVRIVPQQKVAATK